MTKRQAMIYKTQHSKQQIDQYLSHLTPELNYCSPVENAVPAPLVVPVIVNCVRYSPHNSCRRSDRIVTKGSR